MMNIENNYDYILEKVDKAAKTTGRTKDDITVVAVSKTVDVNIIKQAYDYGIRDFGENKMQDMRDKQKILPNDIKWHYIGNLQRNKVKYFKDIDNLELIHSIDRESLVIELEKKGEQQNRIYDVLIQINIAKENTKSGIYEEDIYSFINLAKDFKHIAVKGLMAIAPYFADKEQTRLIFRKMKNIYDDISKSNYCNVEMKYLSMGMTNDYEVAIQEGSNMIRLGSAIFGERKY